MNLENKVHAFLLFFFRQEEKTNELTIHYI